MGQCCALWLAGGAAAPASGRERTADGFARETGALDDLGDAEVGGEELDDGDALSGGQALDVVALAAEDAAGTELGVAESVFEQGLVGRLGAEELFAHGLDGDGQGVGRRGVTAGVVGLAHGWRCGRAGGMSSGAAALTRGGDEGEEGALGARVSSFSLRLVGSRAGALPGWGHGGRRCRRWCGPLIGG